MIHEVATEAFVEGADLPSAQDLRAAALGQSGRALVEALLARDGEAVAAAIDHDRALLRLSADGCSVAEIAVATGDATLLQEVLARGAPADPDGDGRPLILALQARTPDLAWALLDAGASPTPAAAPLEPFRTAIAFHSAGGVHLLLDQGADPNVAGSLDRRPLHVALDMEAFTLAELLLDRGADLWAVDAGGANLGTSVTTPMVRDDAAEAAAQQRLAARALAAGWPNPAPAPREIQLLQREGRWPPRR